MARRVLKKLGLDEKYEGCAEPDGEYFQVEHEDGPKPFKCFLDTGLRRTTTGSRLFGALKGAVDGGLNIPYSEKRFPGYDASEKKADPELLTTYIYGGHVAEYMEYLMEEDDEAYKRQFATYIADGVEPDSLEDYYKAGHEKIRESPEATPSKGISAAKKQEYKKFKTVKLTYDERRERIAQKLVEFQNAA